ncbi:MAG: NAD(+) synthase [Planctomycetes bacterium]|nr:NAD(+) synthase [Planctomycetota bacterium]
MKIALAQINPVTGDLAGNIRKIAQEIDLARPKSADIIIFPEMAVTGYCVSDLLEDRQFVSANKEALLEILPHTRNITAIIGFVDYESHKNNGGIQFRRYNAAAVMQDGKLKGIVHKTLLPNYRYFDDKRYFTPARERRPVRVKIRGKSVSLGISICEDIWDENYDVKPVEELAVQGVDLFVNINASPFSPGKFFLREKTIKRHIRRDGRPFVYVNTVGASDNGKNVITFDGISALYDCKGGLAAVAGQFVEETLFVDMDISAAVKNPLKSPVFRREQEIYEALVMGLRDYARKSGNFTRAIVPVSGGIDSALSLALCAEAFGAGNVTAYNLPSKYNSRLTKSIAKQLAENLGIEYRIIPIQQIDNLVKKVFESSAHKIMNKTAKENMHARIRGLLMMMESNDTGALLVSNGNETEIALGYSTLYGDMCGGISVIGDLPKMDVYKVSSYANERYGRQVIPRAAFEIIPTAELSRGQYDPFDYPVVSPIVNELVERRLDPVELIEMFRKRKLDAGKFEPDKDGKTVYDKHTVKSFGGLVMHCYDLLRRSVYKRLQGPPIIVVSERAFGFDLRETIINKWGDTDELRIRN